MESRVRNLDDVAIESLRRPLTEDEEKDRIKILGSSNLLSTLKVKSKKAVSFGVEEDVDNEAFKKSLLKTVRKDERDQRRKAGRERKREALKSEGERSRVLNRDRKNRGENYSVMNPFAIISEVKEERVTPQRAAFEQKSAQAAKREENKALREAILHQKHVKKHAKHQRQKERRALEKSEPSVPSTFHSESSDSKIIEDEWSFNSTYSYDTAESSEFNDDSQLFSEAGDIIVIPGDVGVNPNGDHYVDYISDEDEKYDSTTTSEESEKVLLVKFPFHETDPQIDLLLKRVRSIFDGLQHAGFDASKNVSAIRQELEQFQSDKKVSDIPISFSDGVYCNFSSYLEIKIIPFLETPIEKKEHESNCKCTVCETSRHLRDDSKKVVRQFVDMTPTQPILKKYNTEMDVVVNFASFALILVRSPTHDSQIAALYMYMSTWGIKDVVIKSSLCAGVGLIALIRSAIRKKLHSESLSDTIQSVQSVMSQIFDCSVLTAVRNLISMCAVLRCFDKETAQRVYDVCGKYTGAYGHVTYMDMVNTVLTAAASISRVIELIIAGQPITKALLYDDPLGDTIVDAKALLPYKTRLYNGIPHPGMKDRREFVREAKDIIAVFESRLPHIKNALKAEVVKLKSELELAVGDILAEDLAMSRIPPIMCLLIGNPGIGKSSILRALYMLFCVSVMETPFEDFMVYSKQITSQFWEGYKDQPIITASEIGNEAQNIAKSVQNTLLRELCSICDGGSYNLDMAFGDKGKTVCKALGVFMDTNTHDLNLDFQINNKAAFWRRASKLVPHVKPNKRIAGTPALDTSKIAPDDYTFDHWYFDLSEFVAISSTQTVEIKLLEASKEHTIYDVFRVLGARWRQHFQVNTKVKEIVDNALKTGPVMKDGTPMDKDYFERAVADIKKIRLEALNSALGALKDSPELENQVAKQMNPRQVKDRAKMRARAPIIPEQKSKEEKGDSKGNATSKKTVLISEAGTDAFALDAEGMKAELLKIAAARAKFEAEKKTQFDKENSSWNKLSFWFNSATSYLESGIPGMFNVYSSMALAWTWSWITSWIVSYVEKQRGKGFLDFSVWAFARALFTVCIGFWFIGPFIFLLVPVSFVRFSFILEYTIFAAAKNVNMEADMTKMVARDAYLRWTGKFKSVSGTFKELSVIVSQLAILGGMGYGAYYMFTRAPTVEEVKETPVISEGGKSTPKNHDEKEVDEVVSELKEQQKAIDTIYKEHFVLSGVVTGPPVAVKGKKNTWSVIRPTDIPVHTTGIETLYAQVKRNVRRCQLVYDEEGQTHQKKFVVFFVKSCIAIFNTHSVPPIEKFRKGVLRISQSGNFHEEERTRDTSVVAEWFCDLGNDVTMCAFSSMQTKDLVSKFTDNPTPTIFDGLIHGVKVACRKNDKIANICDINYSYQLTDTIEYELPVVREGLCGSVLLGDMGKGHVIYGIHTAGNKDSLGISTRITATMIKIGIKKTEAILRKFGLMPFTSECTIPLKLQGPSVYSCIKYVESGSGEYFGKEPGSFMKKSVSELVRFIPRSKLDEIFLKVFGKTSNCHFVKPPLSPFKRDGVVYNMYNIGLEKMTRRKATINKDILATSIKILLDGLVSGLREAGVQKIYVLTLEQAINGVEGNDFIDRINVSTAAGYGHPGKKNKYLLNVSTDPDVVIRVPTDAIMSELKAMEEAYLREESVYCIYNVAPKDEPRLAEKANVGKVRLFMPQPLAHLIMCRKMLGHLVGLFSEHRSVFHCSIGIDMHMEADEVYDLITGKNNLEGDYGGFDTTTPFEIHWAAISVIYSLCSIFGYSDEELLILKGTLTDMIFPIVNMNGDMLSVPGVIASGQCMTAQKNCLINEMFHIVAFVSRGLHKKYKFYDVVRPNTFGDDTCTAVSDVIADEFNCVTFAEDCAKLFGMEFTTSDKGAVTTKFIPQEAMSFLKRTFKFKSEVQRVVGLLSIDSIYKMLEWYAPSKFTSEKTQFLSMFSSCICETFFHTDEEHFNEMRKFLIEYAVEKLDIDRKDAETHIRTFAYHVSKYTRSPSDSIESDVMSVCEGRTDVENYVSESDDVDSRYSVCSHLFNKFERSNPADVHWVSKAANVSFKLAVKESVHSMTGELDFYKSQLAAHPLRSLFPKVAKLKRFLQVRDSTKSYVQHYQLLEIYNKIASLQQSIDVLSEKTSFYTSEADTDSALVTDEFQILHDAMGSNEQKAAQSGDTDVLNLANSEYDLNDFPDRFIKLGDTIPINMDTDYTIEFDPFGLLLDNPTIRAKLRNYALCRFDVEVRILFAGSPFVQGGWLVSPQPCWLYNEYGQSVVANSLDKMPVLTYLSSAPGHQFVNINKNTEVLMELPYISPVPYIRLYDPLSSGVFPATESFDDAKFLTTVILQTVSQMHASNATAPTKVFITFYGRMKNLKLMNPTGYSMEIKSESDDDRVENLLYRSYTSEADSKDERKIGPVERISSSIAAWSRFFTEIPVIGAYARASDLLATSISKIASIWGFSAPNSIKDPVYVKNEPFRNGCQTIVMNTEKRLTFDPKQGLTVDPRVVGRNEDEMSISYIARMPSIIARFAWSNTDPTYTPLFYMQVNPCACPTAADSLTKYCQPTNLAFAANHFQMWQGSISYRVRFFRTQFIRGTMMVLWEPNISQAAIIGADITLNKQCVAMIDLSVEDTVEFTVNYAAHMPWRQCIPLDNSIPDIRQPDVYFSILNSYDSYANGMLMFVPFTTLQTQDSDHIDIIIETWSSDIRFNPLRNLPSYTIGWPDSMEFKSEADNGQEKLTGIGVKMGDTCVFDLALASYGLSLPLNYSEAGEEIPPTRPNSPVFPPDGKPFLAEIIWFPIPQYENLRPDPHQCNYCPNCHLQFHSEADNTDDSFVLNKGQMYNEHITDLTYGEQPMSFRNLLHRFSSSCYERTNEGSDLSVNTMTFKTSKYPFLYPNISGSSPNYPVGPFHLINYLRYAYVGMRGGIMKRITTQGMPYTSSDVGSWTVSHQSSGPSSYLSLDASNGVIIGTEPAGSVRFIPATNGGIEFELPYYCPYLFQWSFASDPTEDLLHVTNDMALYYSVQGPITVGSRNDSGQDFIVMEDTATGDDFSFLCYVGPPGFNYPITVTTVREDARKIENKSVPLHDFFKV